ncbi:hypothetical protein PQ610_04125 [Tardisphaera miroshnichenkoae]
MKISFSIGFFALILIFLVGFGAGFGAYYAIYYRPLDASYQLEKRINLSLSELVTQYSEKISQLNQNVSRINSSYYNAMQSLNAVEEENVRLQQLMLNQIQTNQALSNYYEWKALGLPPLLQVWYSRALSLMPQGGNYGYTQSALSSAVFLSAIDSGDAAWAAKSMSYLGLGSYSYDYALFSNISRWAEPTLSAYDRQVLNIPSGDELYAVSMVLDATSSMAFTNSTSGALLSPLQTLISGGGNQLEACELAAALLKLENINVAIALLSNKANPNQFLFVVLIQLPNLANVYYFPSLSAYGLMGASWGIIQPQLSLRAQNSASWAPSWSVVGVEEVQRG